MASIKFDAIIETAKIVSGFRDIQKAVQQTAEKVGKDGKTIDDIIANIQKSFNIAIGGWSVGKFANQMMQVRGQFQQTEMAFKTMLQSEEKANELMKQMIHTAAITPFNVEEVTKGAKQLLAYNVAAEDVNKTLTGLGDVAAGMGLNLSDLVVLYGTTIAKGKMDLQDLYQFLGRGIPIADELAKVMGLDVSNAIKEVQKQIKAGKVTSDIFIQAMQSMTSEGSRFGGLMEAQSKTITGQISNIEDGIEQMFNELGKSQEGVVNTGLAIVSKLVDNWESVGKVLLTVVSAYGAYKAAVLTMIAISKAQIALNTAVRFIKLASAVTNATQAMRVFNLACSSNVLGLVLGVVAAGVTAFGLFGNTAEDAATKTTKFTESASEASGKVESLVAILKTAKEGSKVYKDTIKELSNIYGNYGITIDKIKDDESNLIDVKQQEIDKSKELIEQIKLETTERNRANAVSEANEEYNNRIDTAQQSLKENLKSFGTSANAMAIGIENIVSDKAIERLEFLLKKMTGLDQHSKEYQTLLREYNTIIGGLIDKANSLAGSLGYTGVKAYDAHKALASYLSAVRAAKKEHAEETENINKAADATEGFGNKTASAADRVKALEKQLQGAGEDVHILYNKVKAFMENYSENDINFHVNFDAKIPAWMTKMNIPELSRMGKFYSALAKDLANNKKSGAKVNGKWMSIDDIAQRGWDYTNQANTKQTKADEEKKRKQREKEEAEANAKKNKKAKDEAKKKAEAQRKAQEELNEDQKQLAQQNIDSEISLMKEGTEKKVAEIKNDYQKRLAEIDKQEAEFKKKNKEAGKKGNLTKEQTTALNTSRSLAAQDYDKQMAGVYKEQVSALNDYLKEYGTFKEKQLAIDLEYNKKIEEAEKNGNIFEAMTLRAQKQKEIGSNKASQLESQIDYTTVFGEFGIILKDQMQGMLNTMKDFAKTSEFKAKPINEQKDFLQRMSQIEQKYGTAKWNDYNFAQVGKLIDTYTAKLKKRNEAEVKLNQSSKKVIDANEEYQKVLVKGTEEQKKAAKQKVDNAAAQNEQDRMALQDADAEVVQAQNDVADAATKLQNTLSSVDNLLGSMKSGSLKSAWDAFTDFDKKVNGGKVTEKVTESIGKVLGKAFEGKSDLVSLIIGAILNLLDTLKEQGVGGLVGGLIDSILGAIDGIVDNIATGEFLEQIVGAIVKGLGKLLTRIDIQSPIPGISYNTSLSSVLTNSNATKVNNRIEELTKSNERLDDSINRLKNTMEKSYGQQAKEAYEEAKRQQEQKNENLKEIAKQTASYHGAHNSWNHYWSGFNDDEIKKIQQAIGKSFNGDIWSLDENDMSTMLGYEWFTDKIRKTGKEYNGRSLYGENVLEALQKYADAAGTIEELTDDFKESLTQVSFDSMKDSFISSLMDMTKSAEDFSDDFAEMMQKALLSYSMEDLLNGDLKTLYDEWAKAIDDSKGQLTETQINEFNKRYDEIVEEGLKRRDDWSKITGYTGSTSQTATSGGWESMGQDTADELNGRFTALQIAGESIAQNMADTVSQMQSIVTLGMSTNGAVLEIRNMMIMTNSYLEDVVKYAKLTYKDFGNKLDDMNARLKNI